MTKKKRDAPSAYHRHILRALSTVTLHLVAETAPVDKVEAALQRDQSTFQMSLYKTQDTPLLPYIE